MPVSVLIWNSSLIRTWNPVHTIFGLQIIWNFTQHILSILVQIQLPWLDFSFRLKCLVLDRDSDKFWKISDIFGTSDSFFFINISSRVDQEELIHSSFLITLWTEIILSQFLYFKQILQFSKKKFKLKFFRRKNPVQRALKIQYFLNL